MANDLIKASNNKQFIEVISIVENARQQAFRKVNEELILMYRDIGKYISEQAVASQYGEIFLIRLQIFSTRIIPI